MKVRGLIWIVLGAIVFGLPYVGGPYLVVRGTNVSWGLVAMGVGAVLFLYDLITKKKDEGAPPPQ
jgi:hypothetical protein